LAENVIKTFFNSRSARLLLNFLLIAAVLAEGYYIYLLQEKIEKRSEELKNISVQLQFFKTEREDLKANLSSAKKTGDAGNENTPAR
jgi:Tfp pilus assembly protein PilO